jgi:hypothetical protein
VSTGSQSGYECGSRLVYPTRSGTPTSAGTAIPNEPAWPERPLPSSYAQSGVEGRSGCRWRQIWRSENAYLPSDAGRATTIPSPDTGNRCTKRRSGRRPPARARSATLHGNTSADPATNPDSSNRLRESLDIVPPIHRDHARAPSEHARSSHPLPDRTSGPPRIAPPQFPARATAAPPRRRRHGRGATSVRTCARSLSSAAWRVS